MVGIWRDCCGYPFTGKVAETKAKAIWWIYKEYKENNPEVYYVSRDGRLYPKRWNIVDFYKRQRWENSHWNYSKKSMLVYGYYLKEVEVVE